MHKIGAKPINIIHIRDHLSYQAKRDDFNFLIVNFQSICSNIPEAPSYGVYISRS